MPIAYLPIAYCLPPIAISPDAAARSRNAVALDPRGQAQRLAGLCRLHVGSAIPALARSAAHPICRRARAEISRGLGAGLSVQSAPALVSADGGAQGQQRAGGRRFHPDVALPLCGSGVGGGAPE